ncbi:MAG: hypothetical protein GX574_06830 [Lentisphaerae bacterium]|nr:hypothetical protein [Lentisphaerota bacterium]
MKPGFYPFWFLNDRLETAEIRRQIQEMHAHGVKGFFLHSRQGLEQPYLSDAFFARISDAVQEAKSHGMIANLYDEYPYPSGVAGGEVLLGNPQWWGTTLRHDVTDIDADGGCIRRRLPIGNVLSCKAFPYTNDHAIDWERGRDLRSAVGVHLGDESYNIGGLTPYNRKRYFASNPTPVLETTLPKGRWRLVATVQAVITGHKYWDHFVDVMNPEAIRAFIALTHERYWQRLGTDFGHTVKAIFVDEVCAAWSALLPPRFQREKGYDILSRLEAIADPTHPDHWQVSADLARVKHLMFCESFDAPLRDWCRQHGIAYCGEKTSYRFSQLAYMDIPGCEPGHTKAGADKVDTLQSLVRGNARATAAAAYFYNKPGALCECFHSLGWGGTLQDARNIAENLVLLGISYLVPHGFFYSTHALKKHDAPPTFFFQMPYWRFFGALSQRLERITTAFVDTWIDADTIVLDPNAGLPDRDDRDVCEVLYHALMANRVEFMVADTDIIAAATVQNGALQCRDLNIRRILVPPMRAPEPEWLETAARLRLQGIECRDIASRDDALAAAAAAAQASPSSLPFTVVAGDCAKIWMTARRQGARRVWFLQNLGSEPAVLAFDQKTAATLREIVLDDIAGPALSLAPDGSCQCCIAPFASALLTNGDGVPAAPALPIVTAALPLACTVKPLNANLLRLGRWRLSLAQDDDPTWGPAAEVDAIPIANQLKQARLAFRPTIAESFGMMPRLTFPNLRLRYEATFICQCTTPVTLVMEPGSIGGNWRLELNDSWQARADQLQPAPSGVHVPGSLSLNLTPGLQPGENRLVVIVEATRADHGLCNPLYLAGDFAVNAATMTLVSPCQHGEFENYERNGLPFFAGTVEYTGAFAVENLPATPTCLLRLSLPTLCEEALEIAVNDSAWLPMPWNPRQAIIPTAILRQGSNAFRLRVATTLIRAFEGEAFDIKNHRQVKVN